MKRTNFLLFIWLCFFSANLFAQTGGVQIADWQLFEPSNEEYSIELPQKADLVYEDKKEGSQRFSVKFNGRFLFIFSESLKTAIPDKTLQDFIKSSGAAPTEATISGFSVQKYSFKYSDEYFHNLWMVKTKDKIYAFHSASETENDEIVDKFFKSLKFNRRLPQELKKQTSAVKIEKAVWIGKEKASLDSAFGGDETSLFADSRIGTNFSIQTVSGDSPMQITSKPRANYTDFARFFDIQGIVRLRVTFLATGEIGVVEVVKRLPFGLTENSVRACRMIRFDPARRDGNAINVTRLVEYSFTIY